jgi:serine/threonine-protein kinase SRPK3
MAFALQRRRFPKVALGFAPQLAPRRQVQAITFALPRTPRAPPPIARIRSHTSTRMAHSSTRVVIDPTQMIEEETVPGYKAEHYYPVQIGQVFQDRYSVVGKLGYGSASTVWLCHDLRNNKAYVALKVYINRSKVHRELPIYTHINSLKTEHAGRDSLRKLLDSFKITGPHGNHICLVHQALGMSLEDVRDVVPDREFAADLVRQTLRDILRVLHFFREEAHVIHTGLQFHFASYCAF